MSAVFYIYQSILVYSIENSRVGVLRYLKKAHQIKLNAFLLQPKVTLAAGSIKRCISDVETTFHVTGKSRCGCFTAYL